MEATDFGIITVEDDDRIKTTTVDRCRLDPVEIASVIVEAFTAQLE